LVSIWLVKIDNTHGDQRIERSIGIASIEWAAIGKVVPRLLDDLDQILGLEATSPCHFARKAKTGVYVTFG
jgi:hypothetical protein